MTILLVGETIDRRTAYSAALTGELIRLVRGVYAAADDDVDATVMAHAVRIAHYLYPAAYLAAASASLLRPTTDGRLFLGGRRNQRTRIRTLEIVQTTAPARPATVLATVGDSLGNLTISVSAPLFRFLEAFRLRSEHASAITDALRDEMAARLVQEYASPTAVADAIWALARLNGWLREAEFAERYLTDRSTNAPVRGNAAAIERLVAWHGEPLGRLAHDGVEWQWTSLPNTAPSVVRQTRAGALPSFIESLLPEGWLAQVLHERDDTDALRHGKRFMSNITVAASLNELDELQPDVLQAPLAHFTTAGEFVGRYGGPSRGTLAPAFEEKLAQLFAHSATPRLSGVQIKAPMLLTADGTLRPAIDDPFTHILKPAAPGGFGALPLVEWICLELARAAGFVVPDAALVAMPDDMLPALIVERFDIRRDANDHRRLALEDFCSVLDLPSSRKYEGTIERVARAMRAVSTDPVADLELLFRRALFAWLIADGDTHLKNLALLRIAPADTPTFDSVRLAPVYDAITTRVFPGLTRDRMALTLSGKDDRLKPHDFVQLARTIELPIARAEAAMAALLSSIDNAAAALALPAFTRDHRDAVSVVDRVRALVTERCAAFSASQ